jgi:hypothetical protein
MLKNEFLKSNLFKFFIVLFLVVCIIKIFTSGYHFGQWIYDHTH